MVINETTKNILLDIITQKTDQLTTKIAKILINQDNNDQITDEYVAEALNIESNIARKKLYNLSDLRIASYRRFQNDEGWNTYFWQLIPEGVIDIVLTEQQKSLEELQQQLLIEQSTMFYQCTNNCEKVPFEDALNTGFICSCGEFLKEVENTATIATLEGNIEAVEHMISQYSNIRQQINVV